TSYVVSGFSRTLRRKTRKPDTTSKNAKAGRYVDQPRWSLPTAPAEPNASVDKTRRPDRRGQRADEILPVEDILHTEEDLEVRSDGPLSREIDHDVPRKPGIGGRHVPRLAQRRGRYHSRIQIVVELPADELYAECDVDELQIGRASCRERVEIWVGAGGGAIR